VLRKQKLLHENYHKLILMLLCGRSIGRITRLARLSVRRSLCLSTTKCAEKPKLGRTFQEQEQSMCHFRSKTQE